MWNSRSTLFLISVADLNVLCVSAGSIRTNPELETVSRVRVDVFERLLHGKSEQNQLAKVLPAVLTLLDALEWRITGNGR